MKRLFAVAVAFVLACTFIVSSALADTSYFLLQGPFGGGDLTTTHKWKFVYEPGDLASGGDLLEMIFGTPVEDEPDSGRYTAVLRHVDGQIVHRERSYRRDANRLVELLALQRRGRVGRLECDR
jgi:hypothetical protein